MTAGCGEDWTPTASAEHLRAGLRQQPNWRDQPDELAQLCEEGRRDLYGEFIPERDIDTITAREEYL